MGESIFRAEGERFLPTEHARGPWDPRALHGGAPAALMTSAFERMQPGAKLAVARLGFELLRPVPLAPLSISTRIVRAGRRVQELAGEIHAGEDLICRASALRVQPVPDGLPEAEPSAGGAPPMPGPEAGREVRFALDDSTEASFAASAMEMRFLDDPLALGPARVWMRLRHPLLPDEPASSLAR
ncbi:MAG TPA: acyl-CoA thioesterase domain-containing protein, partial [Solirubrobacteraceae bacterium]|nr:acyl-CoA thioesterase domain-containing protein [Solirubrobacteraceae bacterium]